MTTQELRMAFAVEGLFVQDNITMVYADADRAIIGGAAPVRTPLKLMATKKEMAAEYFTERRELGIVNIGGEGKVQTDSAEHTLQQKDMLYVGRGVKNVELSSSRADQPALFYFVSFPAHTSHPVTLVRFADAEPAHLGKPEDANKRTIYKYIHMGGAKSCQLVMGLTDLESGSVWNTMPPHTHMRRMEVYMYFGLDADAAVVHLMGKPDETRNLILRNHEAVISPSWSVHCGAATRRYSFVWAMGGENQEFSDMDPVAMTDLM
jgi:4-deoxy-L-threo-5-hexosulose-uronate ketol-isomerase